MDPQDEGVFNYEIICSSIYKQSSSCRGNVDHTIDDTIGSPRSSCSVLHHPNNVSLEKLETIERNEMSIQKGAHGNRDSDQEYRIKQEFTSRHTTNLEQEGEFHVTHEPRLSTTSNAASANTWSEAFRGWNHHIIKNNKKNKCNQNAKSVASLSRIRRRQNAQIRTKEKNRDLGPNWRLSYFDKHKYYTTESVTEIVAEALQDHMNIQAQGTIKLVLQDCLHQLFMTRRVLSRKYLALALKCFLHETKKKFGGYTLRLNYVIQAVCSEMQIPSKQIPDPEKPQSYLSVQEPQSYLNVQESQSYLNVQEQQQSYTCPVGLA